jgi:hypothetical protein
MDVRVDTWRVKAHGLERVEGAVFPVMKRTYVTTNETNTVNRRAIRENGVIQGSQITCVYRRENCLKGRLNLRLQ